MTRPPEASPNNSHPGGQPRSILKKKYRHIPTTNDEQQSRATTSPPEPTNNSKKERRKSSRQRNTIPRPANSQNTPPVRSRTPTPAMSYRHWQITYENRRRVEDPPTSYLHSYTHPTQTQVNHIFPPIHGRQTSNGDGKRVHFQLPQASLRSYDQPRRAHCPNCRRHYGNQEGFPFHRW